MDLRSLIRDIPDFPKPGIVFKDITPLLRSPGALHYAGEAMAAPFRDQNITAVAAIESRGFIFGAAVAHILGVGFVPIRKPGKLPFKTRRNEYTLEYGSGILEIHDDALTPDDRVLIVDDVLATGGTASGAAALIRDFGAAIAGASMLIELAFLDGRKCLPGLQIRSLITY